MHLQQIGFFLTDIYHLFKKYERKQNNLSHQFNLFSLFGYERNENIHSDFIAELLKPNGMHGQGSIFLNLFMQNCIPILSNKSVNNYQTASVNREYYLGKVNLKRVNGGQVDIRVQCQNQILYIENKIDAEAQNLQLERYLAACNDVNHIVVLLTLNKESEAKYLAEKTELTNAIDKGQLVTITYQHHIISWLECCKKEMADTNGIREVINQYLYCLKKITNRIEDNMSKNELIDTIMQDARSIKSFLYLSQIEQEEIYIKLHAMVFDKIINIVEAKFKTLITPQYVHKVEKCNYLNREQFYADKRSWLGLNFYNDDVEKQNLRIRFEFAYREKAWPFIGLCFTPTECDGVVSKQQQFILSQVKNYLNSGSRTNKSWLYRTDFFEHADEKINFGEWIYEPELLDYLLSTSRYMNNGFSEDIVKFIEVVLEACKKSKLV